MLPNGLGTRSAVSPMVQPYDLRASIMSFSSFQSVVRTPLAKHISSPPRVRRRSLRPRLIHSWLNAPCASQSAAGLLKVAVPVDLARIRDGVVSGAAVVLVPVRSGPSATRSYCTCSF